MVSVPPSQALSPRRGPWPRTPQTVRLAWTIAAGAVASFVPTTARAGNGVHPRTPVLWPDPPCMTVVDRSIGATVILPYDIPFEDTEVTPDEVSDSRRHQFLGFCEPTHPQRFLPLWITDVDVDAAAAKGLLDPDGLTTEDVLETSTTWAGCWDRITGDDERRPITFEMADEDIVWDVSSLPPGTYTVYGYTWEPAFNLWTRRPGAVKIVDGADPASTAPAAAISSPEIIVRANEIAEVEGCVDAMDGSTISAWWAPTEGGGEPQWMPFVEDQPVTTGDFIIDFAPPEEAVGRSIMIRVDVNDPMTRSYTTYMSDLVIVLKGTGGTGGCESGNFVTSPECGDSSTTAPMSPTDGGPQCACVADPRRRNRDLWLAAALPIVAVAWRRRSRP